MYALCEPYNPIPANDARQADAFRDLRAVVHGTAHCLFRSPRAIDRMNVHGIGVYQRPRTERLFAPCRCKLIGVSPDRTVWVFALTQFLRVRVEILAENPLPLVFTSAPMGTLLAQGEEFAQLNPQWRGSGTTVITTVQQIDVKNCPVRYLATPVSGNMSAAEDTIVRLYTLPIAAELHSDI